MSIISVLAGAHYHTSGCQAESENWKGSWIPVSQYTLAVKNLATTVLLSADDQKIMYLRTHTLNVLHLRGTIGNPPNEGATFVNLKEGKGSFFFILVPFY